MIQGYRGMMTDRIMVHGPSFSNWWLLVEVVEVVEIKGNLKRAKQRARP